VKFFTVVEGASAQETVAEFVEGGRQTLIRAARLLIAAGFRFTWMDRIIRPRNAGDFGLAGSRLCMAKPLHDDAR
jgi:hypothetical protein